MNRQQLWLCAAIGFAVISLSRSAHAGKTWCIGGFNFNPMSDSPSQADHGCYAEGKNRGILDAGESWHWHDNMFVTRGSGNRCYTCWDMEDNTCEDEALHQGWREISAKECADLVAAKKKDIKFVDPEGRFKEPEDPLVVKTVDPLVLLNGPSPPADTQNAPPKLPPPLLPDDPVVIAPPPQDDIVQTPTGKPPATKPPTKKPVAPAKRKVYIKLEVSPGPYAVNDPITVTGFAYTDAGRRRVSGGKFAVVQNGQPVMGPDGKPLLYAAKITKRGAATATLSIPTSGTVTLRFAPQEIEAAAREVLLGPDAPGEATLTLGQCRLRGVVLAPTEGEVLAAAQKSKIALRGRFETSAGAASSDLGGATPTFGIEVGGQSLKVAATLDGADFVGELELDPPDGRTDDLVVRMLGEGGQNDVCPGTPVTARVTRLGIALALTTKGNCYVDRPCQLEGRFVLPKGAARAAAEAFASAPDLVFAVRENHQQVATLTAVNPGQPESLFTGSYVPTGAGVVTLRGVATSAAQSREIDERTRADIREPIVFTLPTQLDLGAVAAGSDSPAGCQTLDFSKSRGVIDQAFVLVVDQPSGCDSTPATLSGGMAVPLTSPATIELAYDSLAVPICLTAVPRCASERPKPARLTITPKNPDFADQATMVEIAWRVEGRNFLACHWWWIAAIAGGLFILLVGYGFVKPSNFSPHDAIKMAGDRKKLTRAVGRRLRELPGGRSGWYRNAATGIRDDGSATDKRRLAAVMLHARRGEVYLTSRGGLQRVHPGTKKLEPVDTGKDGVVAAKGVIYNVGSLFFQIG